MSFGKKDDMIIQSGDYMNDYTCLKLRMAKESRTAWNTLLQRGFYLNGPANRTVRAFVNDVFEFDDCFIDETVRTIFLNSSPVDDIDEAFVRDGDRLALGSAMPGLVGICMGRDNPYKSFRSGIACHDEGGEADSTETIRVFAKVFSTLAVESGEDILKRGIEADAGQLVALLREKAAFVLEGPAPDALPKEGEVAVAVTFEE